MDPKELEERRHVAEQEADNLKRAAPRITLLNEPLRHHERDGSLPAESAGELGEDDHLGVQPNRSNPPDASGDIVRFPASLRDLARAVDVDRPT